MTSSAANNGSFLIKFPLLDIIKSADHVIDLGPEGGKKGGQIIAEGTPEKVSTVKASYTGQYLKNLLS